MKKLILYITIYYIIYTRNQGFDENHEYPLLPNGKSTENAIFTVQT